MAPIEDPLPMQKILEVKRGPITRTLGVFVEWFGIVSYILIILAILGIIFGGFYVYKRGMEKRKRLNPDLTFDSDDDE
ncbi:Oidioi.mRNA.OKI2018_I69.chr2.g5228.t1.cds [Oikopleura dioica]|uniref:Oidioi.mRNA.OKI2018_I69.chr2.g5228.t1.cds n=1 Tax=Oikopleura dioica TaxID=34765 RepID=A0ABN7T8W3_OIKDI|nr:Oidioi.mRNA.OKI2018_I69.chr2.g5228.t1.cds [Oikopleura dioica]